MTISLQCFKCNLPPSHEDPLNGNFLCSPCFVETNEIDLVIQKTLARICAGCQSTKTPQWHTYEEGENEGQDQCNKCHKAASKALGKICVSCQSTKASYWVKYKEGESNGENQCDKCYNTARRVFALSGNSGQICAGCESTKTSQWYTFKAGENKGKKKCKRCYDVLDRVSLKRQSTSFTNSSSKKRSITLVDSVKNPSEQGCLSRTPSEGFSSNLRGDLLNDSLGSGGGA